MVHQTHFWTEFHIPWEAYFRTTIRKLLIAFGGFGKDANLLVLLSFIGSIGNALFGLVMVLYLQALGYSTGEIGVLLALSTLTLGLALIPCGMFADRFSRIGVIVLGNIFGVLTVGLFLCANSYNLFAIANVLNGLSGACFGPALNSLLSEKTSDMRRKYLFSLNAFSGTIGNTFGMILGGILPDIQGYSSFDGLFGFKMVFLLAFTLSVARTVGYLFVHEKKPVERKTVQFVSGSWHIVRLFAVTSLLLGFGAGLVIPWFQLYFRLKFGASYTDIGYVFGVQQFILALAILLMPKLADRSGSVNTIVFTQVLAIIVLVMIPGFALFALVAILFVIRAVLMNIANPIQGAFMMGLVRAEDRASTTAVNTLCWTGAWALGTFVAGYVMEWNIDAPFFITAVFYTVYVVLFYLFFKKYDKKGTCT